MFLFSVTTNLFFWRARGAGWAGGTQAIAAWGWSTGRAGSTFWPFTIFVLFLFWASFLWGLARTFFFTRRLFLLALGAGPWAAAAGGGRWTFWPCFLLIIILFWLSSFRLTRGWARAVTATCATLLRLAGRSFLVSGGSALRSSSGGRPTCGLTILLFLISSTFFILRRSTAGGGTRRIFASLLYSLRS